MEIARGMFVIGSGPGEYTRKPRPYLVVQSNMFNAEHASLSLCPVTTRRIGTGLFRVPVSSSEQTGLHEDSEIQIDKVQTLRRERIAQTLGVAPAEVVEQVDQALRRWLAL